jgi:hypothetical protein
MTKQQFDIRLTQSYYLLPTNSENVQQMINENIKKNIDIVEFSRIVFHTPY